MKSITFSEYKDIDQVINKSMEEQQKAKPRLQIKEENVKLNSNDETSIYNNGDDDARIQRYLTQERLLDEILQIREELKVWSSILYINFKFPPNFRTSTLK